MNRFSLATKLCNSKFFAFFLITNLCLFSSCDTKQLESALGTVMGDTSGGVLSQAQIGSGLKEALNLGVTNGVDILSKKGGYLNSIYKVALPEEAQKLTNTLQKVPGFSNLESKLIEKINAACEDAATKAKPIFVNAIRSMSINDAMNILMGDKNAATQYLNSTTNKQLYNEFEPVVVNSLNKFGALDLWTDAVTAYNKIPLVKKMNPSLQGHITDKALGGLFSMVEKKEADIRNNVSSRPTDLLKKVFAKQD